MRGSGTPEMTQSHPNWKQCDNCEHLKQPQRSAVRHMELHKATSMSSSGTPETRQSYPVSSSGISKLIRTTPVNNSGKPEIIQSYLNEWQWNAQNDIEPP